MEPDLTFFGEDAKFIDLEGFYVNEERCVHITFDDDETFVIDIYDSPLAGTPFYGSKAQLVGKPIVVNTKTGEVKLEE